MTGFEGEEAFVDDLLGKFPGRRADARAFALKYRVLLLSGSNSTPLDVALGAMPFEEGSIERSSLWTLDQNIQLRTCCAEDLVVHKVFAGRERDWLDIEGVLHVQRDRLKLDEIRIELAPLLALKDSMESLQRFEQLCRKSGIRGS